MDDHRGAKRLVNGDINPELDFGVGSSTYVSDLRTNQELRVKNQAQPD